MTWLWAASWFICWAWCQLAWNIPLVSSGKIPLFSWGQLSQHVPSQLLVTPQPTFQWGGKLKSPWFSANTTYKQHRSVFSLSLSQIQNSTIPATRKKSNSMPSKIRTDISISCKWLKITFAVILSHLFLSWSQEKYSSECPSLLSYMSNADWWPQSENNSAGLQPLWTKRCFLLICCSIFTGLRMRSWVKMIPVIYLSIFISMWDWVAL